MKFNNNMQKHNKILMIPLSIFLGIFLINFVCAADPVASIVNPVASATISGATSAVNVSVTNPSATGFNCTIYLTSTLTANTTEVSVGLFRNNTAGEGSSNAVNGTINTLGVEDANNYIIKASCVNNSGFSFNDTNTGIIVNNTIPVAPTITSTNDQTFTTSGIKYLEATVTNARTTSCTMLVQREDGYGSTSSACSYSTTLCNCSTPSFSYDAYTNGKWIYYITASDESDRVVSTTNSFKMDLATPGGSVTVGGGGSSGGAAVTPATVSTHADVATTTSTTTSAATGFFAPIQAFFNNIINWFKNLFN
jgi:hypothetical protein